MVSVVDERLAIARDAVDDAEEGPVRTEDGAVAPAARNRLPGVEFGAQQQLVHRQ